MPNANTDHSRALPAAGRQRKRLRLAGQERRRLNVVITVEARDALDRLVLIHGDRGKAINALLEAAGKIFRRVALPL